MERKKHSLTLAGSKASYHAISNHSGFKSITRTPQLHTALVFAGLLSLMALNPVLAGATPPKHANEQANSQLIGDTLPEETRAERVITKEWVRGRILVMPRAGLPAKALSEILKEHDGKARKIGQSDLYIVDLPEYTEEGAVTRLQHHPHLKFAELDHYLSPTLIPNDPYYNYNGDAWHHPMIGTPLAWDSSQGANITIAILDSGVEASHPDLASKIVSGWNFYDNNSDTSPVTSHGTTVAGTAAAITNNDIGVAGLAGQSKIMPLRVSDANGYGYSSTIAQGLTYAADHGARVANASFQGVTSSLTIRNAAQYMKDKDGLVIVAAGNTGILENYTTTSAMIPISSTDQNDEKSIWSSYGDFVALAAPGDGIWTTQTNGRYARVSGTSQASPVAAGVVALMMSANPKLSSREIENLLFSTAVDLGIVGRDPYFGYGRVNAAAAVQAAKVAITTQDTEAPVISITDPLEGATVNGLVSVDIEAIDNVGLAQAELWINNTSVAVDTSSPFAFSWDTTGAQNGTTNLEVRVFDTAGNVATSTIEVNVENPLHPPFTDTEPPVVDIINPVEGNVSGNIAITVNASDNGSASDITLSIYIDSALKTVGTGGTLSTSWNTRAKGTKTGAHTIQAVAKDATGNTTTTSVNVNVVK